MSGLSASSENFPVWNFASPGEDRAKSTVSNGDITIASSDILDLVASDPGSVDARAVLVHQFHRFFEHNSITSLPPAVQNELMRRILGYVRSNIDFGLYMFIAIICQKPTDRMGLDLGREILAAIAPRLAEPDDSDSVWLSLHVVVHIARESAEMAQLVSSVVNHSYMLSIVANPAFPAQTRKKGIITVGLCIEWMTDVPSALVEDVCRVAAAVINEEDKSKQFSHFVEEVINCCRVVIERGGRTLWREGFARNGLIQKLNLLLVNSSRLGLRLAVLKLAKSAYCSDVAAEFDVLAITNIMTDESASLQVYAIRCLRTLVESKGPRRQQLVEIGIIGKLAACLADGVFIARREALHLVLVFCQTADISFVERLVAERVIEGVFGLLETSEERVVTSGLSILSRCVDLCEQYERMDGFVRIIASLGGFDTLTVLLDNPTENIAESTQRLLHRLGQ